LPKDDLDLLERIRIRILESDKYKEDEDEDRYGLKRIVFNHKYGETLENKNPVDKITGTSWYRHWGFILLAIGIAAAIVTLIILLI
jgi:hypothetical protein